MSSESREGQPVILLCGHMDTVAGHLPLRIEEGKIYARGAVDAKGPLAAMIMAAVDATKGPDSKENLRCECCGRGGNKPWGQTSNNSGDQS